MRSVLRNVSLFFTANLFYKKSSVLFLFNFLIILYVYIILLLVLFSFKKYRFRSLLMVFFTVSVYLSFWLISVIILLLKSTCSMKVLQLFFITLCVCFLLLYMCFVSRYFLFKAHGLINFVLI